MKKILLIALGVIILSGCNISPTEEKTTETTENVSVTSKEQETTNETNKTENMTTTEIENMLATETVNKKEEAAVKEFKDNIVQNQKEENQKQKEIYESQQAELKEQIEEYNKKVELHNKRVANTYKNEDPSFLKNQINVNAAFASYDDNGDLYMIFYVTNGYNSFAYNINLESVTVYDRNGNLIAEIKDYYLGDGGINSNSYATIDYYFKGNEVKIVDTDLSFLKVISYSTDRH